MGIDYVQLNSPSPQIPPPVFPLAVGRDDNDWPVGDGGGPDTTFVQENGTINPLPGSPVSTEDAHGADNDYYFGGNYTTTIGSVVPPTALTRQSVWYPPTKKPPSAPSPGTTMTCVITSTFPIPCHPPSWYR